MLSRPAGWLAIQPPSIQSARLCYRATFQTASSATASRLTRRRSSSKTSTPPGSSNSTNGPRSPAQAPATASTVTEDPVTDAVERKPLLTSTSRRKHRSNEAATEDLALKARHHAFGHVPAVPPTAHLALEDVKLSSLFAIDRPIPVTKTGLPPFIDTKRFNSLFEPPSTAQTIRETTYTLSSAISALDSATTNSRHGLGSRDSRESHDLHSDVLRESPTHNSIIHLDDPPNPEQLRKLYLPFRKPPAPIALGDGTAVRAEAKRRASAAAKEAKAAKQAEDRIRKSPPLKRWTTTLTIEERNDGQGGSTFSATASPILEQEADKPVHVHEELNPPVPQNSERSWGEATRTIMPARQPFLARMRARQTAQLWGLDEHINERQAKLSARHVQDQASDDDTAVQERTHALGQQQQQSDGDVKSLNAGRQMLLISVKRQRKLKMKKHKYKKLMRRTRNLRRREGRN